jgi:hypothetical protein
MNKRLNYTKVALAALIALPLAAISFCTIRNIDHPIIYSAIFGSPHVTATFIKNEIGQSVETKFHVPYKSAFGFYLDLKFNTPQQRAYIEQYVGDGGRRADGTLVNEGLPIPIHLTVRRLESDQNPIFDKQFTHEQLIGYTVNAFSKRITSLMLEQGDYDVRITLQQDVREFVNVPIEFGIGLPGNIK